jgi:hypothetical protein
VVEAAKADPERFGDLPWQMDETGKVSPAYYELRRRPVVLALGPAGRYRRADSQRRRSAVAENEPDDPPVLGAFALSAAVGAVTGCGCVYAGVGVEFAVLYGVAAGLIVLYRCRAWFFPSADPDDST